MRDEDDDFLKQTWWMETIIGIVFLALILAVAATVGFFAGWVGL